MRKKCICRYCGREYVVESDDISDPLYREDWCGCTFIPKDAPEWMKEPFQPGFVRRTKFPPKEEES